MRDGVLMIERVSAEELRRRGWIRLSCDPEVVAFSNEVARHHAESLIATIDTQAQEITRLRGIICGWWSDP